MVVQLVITACVAGACQTHVPESWHGPDAWQECQKVLHTVQTSSTIPLVLCEQVQHKSKSK